MAFEDIIVGVEIGATKIQLATGYADGRVEQLKRESADAGGGASAILRQVERMTKALTADRAVAAMGIGFGGPVDYQEGRVITSHQVAGWDDFPLAKWAEDSFRMPCCVGNDSDMATLAEATVGAGRGKQCVFYTNIGSGIGGGLVKNGELYVGHLGAMEFGHNWTYSELEGRWDVVENLCSGWALGRRARQMAGQAPDSLLAQLCEGQVERIDARLVTEAWQRGDALACRLMDDMVHSFSRALANVVALLNPDIIVIGGGVALIGDPLFRALRQATNQYAFAPFTKNFTIEPASLGERCVPVGALLLAARHGNDPGYYCPGP